MSNPGGKPDSAMLMRLARPLPCQRLSSSLGYGIEEYLTALSAVEQHVTLLDQNLTGDADLMSFHVGGGFDD
jgi:hypothetical protein